VWCGERRRFKGRVGVTTVADTTAASSRTVAALVVSGGIGVTKASMFGGSLSIVGATTIVDTTAAGDKLTGALISSSKKNLK
jgi:sugar/nucleoside kinase (ribokinase family)